MPYFKQLIAQGIPAELPQRSHTERSRSVNGSENTPAPKRKDILSKDEKILAIRNALRYFPAEWHAELAPEFAKELKEYGRIYMHRFKLPASSWYYAYDSK